MRRTPKSDAKRATKWAKNGLFFAVLERVRTRTQWVSPSPDSDCTLVDSDSTSVDSDSSAVDSDSGLMDSDSDSIQVHWTRTHSESR